MTEPSLAEDSTPRGVATRIGLDAAAATARAAVGRMTGLEIDAVAACAPRGEGWRVVIDAVEAPARLGDNDLIATFEIELDAAGDVASFLRTGRYVRGGGAA